MGLRPRRALRDRRALHCTEEERPWPASPPQDSRSSLVLAPPLTRPPARPRGFRSGPSSSGALCCRVGGRPRPASRSRADDLPGGPGRAPATAGRSNGRPGPARPSARGPPVTGTPNAPGRGSQGQAGLGDRRSPPPPALPSSGPPLVRGDPERGSAPAGRSDGRGGDPLQALLSIPYRGSSSHRP
ncbi:hypothetical protein NDU88_001784 [Pleurodeles waltl]|uniref:Uncharacterized protein n=1 Tax=Pleurodeles waltl TaxID=8319 RepID=A0AAV7Q505_PLEWA|nr:hypothetical protein NDU88_001784 [Pleurodeles waltl]